MELQEENKYQLSLRDMTYKEKINQLTEKFIQQINSLNTEKEVKMTQIKSLSVWLQEWLMKLW